MRRRWPVAVPRGPAGLILILLTSTLLSGSVSLEREGLAVADDFEQWSRQWRTDLSGNYSAPEATITPREQYQNMALSQLSRQYSDPAELYAEWEALKELWGRESGWNPTAQNPTTSAYGIPQAMLSYDRGVPGSEHYGINNEEWKNDPSAQIAWGIQYIINRYGSIRNAYEKWLWRKDNDPRGPWY